MSPEDRERLKGFSKETCYKNLKGTIDRNISNISFLMDGNIDEHFLKDEKEFKIVKIKGGSQAKSWESALEHVINNNFSDEQIIYFIEDDYLHFEPMLEEMVASYERMASQLNKDIFICPSDYPYLYMSNEKTNILIGNKRHWRTVNKTLCTFMTSKYLLNKYWENFEKTCLDRNEPFEKYINEIYEKEICLSPLKSLSLHMTNINSSYGLAPFIDYKKLWDENK